jgi:hypothetical protein
MQVRMAFGTPCRARGHLRHAPEVLVRPRSSHLGLLDAVGMCGVLFHFPCPGSPVGKPRLVVVAVQGAPPPHMFGGRILVASSRAMCPSPASPPVCCACAFPFTLPSPRPSFSLLNLSSILPLPPHYTTTLLIPKSFPHSLAIQCQLLHGKALKNTRPWRTADYARRMSNEHWSVDI